MAQTTDRPTTQVPSAVSNSSPRSQPRRKLLPWGIAAALAVGILSAGVISQQRQRSGLDIDALTVPVEEESVTIRITASGTVQPIDSVNLSPKTAGILEQLLVEQGDQVEAGQEIAFMEADSVTADVARARAQVARNQAQLAALLAGNRPEEIAQAEARVWQAEARLADAQSQLALATDRLERNQTLANEGAISRDELDGAVNQESVARATVALQEASLREATDSLALIRRGARSEDIEAAEAQLAEAQAQLQLALVQQEDAIVRAPFAGTITQKFATEGSFVTPTTSASDAVSATSTAIVSLADGLEILAEVPEVDIGQIQVGQRVEILADAYPDELFEGRVQLVSPEAVVEQNVTSFQVRVELLTGLDRLLSGMNVDATFVGDNPENGLVVPTVSIVTLDGQAGVLVPGARDRIRFRPITIGSAVDSKTQVLEGLEEGSRVFVDLPPGQSLENLNFGRDRANE
ncbi:MAG: efflux RND transporter periplasmic adaptor subunit [Synechococcus sp.]